MSWHTSGETQKGRLQEDGGLEWWSYKPGNCPEPPETGKTRMNPALEAWEGAWSYWYLNLELLASRSIREFFLKSMVLRTITSWLLVGAVPHCVIHSMKTQDEWRLDWKTITRWKEMLQHVDTIVSDPHSLKNSLSLWASLSPMNSETQESKYFHGMGNFIYLTPYSIPALFKWKDYSSSRTVRSKGIFLRIKT